MRYLCVLALLACACAAPEGGSDPSAAAQQGQEGLFQRYDANVNGRRYRIDTAAQSAGTLTVVVTSQNARGVDRSEAPVAYAAVQQIAPTACRGKPMTVDGNTARFIDGDRTFDVLTRGQPAWMFIGLCGS